MRKGSILVLALVACRHTPITVDDASAPSVELESADHKKAIELP